MMGLSSGKDAKALLRTTIRSFLSSGGPPYLILDTRSRPVFQARHLAPSTNIPLDRLDGCWFQLPAKQAPFAVLEDEQGAATSTSPCIESIRSSDILKSHGWEPQWVFQDHPLFWSAMAEEMSLQPQLASDQERAGIDHNGDGHIQIIESIGTGRGSQPPYHFLFRPNPDLVKILPQIEQELVRLRSTSEPDKTTPLLRCLDVGCGSGRDMIYMVARSANDQAIRGAEWSTLGLDQREDMCALVQQLARDTFLCDDSDDKIGNDTNGSHPGRALASRVSTITGKIDPTTGVLWVSSSSTSGPMESRQQPLRLKNVRYRDEAMDEAHQQLLNQPTDSTTPDERFDLVVMIRFLQRPLFAPLVHHWLRPGGFIVLSTFVSDHDLPQYSKPGPAHRLQSKTEARDIFEGLGLKVVMDEISLIEDGTRPVATVVAQKLP
ncbi:hypothetical protein B0O80DRAFT_447571 [Mortierella sp. GBAus27b]|nr:hypothetical protein B0O80DRAFT_447571 [Mortierella sp. GBAus27b]